MMRLSTSGMDWQPHRWKGYQARHEVRRPGHSVIVAQHQSRFVTWLSEVTWRHQCNAGLLACACEQVLPSPNGYNA